MTGCTPRGIMSAVDDALLTPLYMQSPRPAPVASFFSHLPSCPDFSPPEMSRAASDSSHYSSPTSTEAALIPSPRCRGCVIGWGCLHCAHCGEAIRNVLLPLAEGCSRPLERFFCPHCGARLPLEILADLWSDVAPPSLPLHAPGAVDCSPAFPWQRGGVLDASRVPAAPSRPVPVRVCADAPLRMKARNSGGLAPWAAVFEAAVTALPSEQRSSVADTSDGADGAARDRVDTADASSSAESSFDAFGADLKNHRLGNLLSWLSGFLGGKETSVAWPSLDARSGNFPVLVAVGARTEEEEAALPDTGSQPNLIKSGAAALRTTQRALSSVDESSHQPCVVYPGTAPKIDQTRRLPLHERHHSPRVRLPATGPTIAEHLFARTAASNDLGSRHRAHRWTSSAGTRRSPR